MHFASAFQSCVFRESNPFPQVVECSFTSTLERFQTEKASSCSYRRCSSCCQRKHWKLVALALSLTIWTLRIQFLRNCRSA